MQNKTLLITGGAGFIGSNLAVSFKEKYPRLRVIALDNLKRRGSELNLPRLKGRNIKFIHADIRNPEDLKFKNKIDFIIECSAEPSVLAGYTDNPLYIINTNIIGTINCLELARKNKSDVIFLSTSRVYPFAAINRIRFKETKTRFEWLPAQKICGWSRQGINTDFTTSGPKTLYGATKLASELILREYLDIYGIRGVVNRCGVVAGPWQFGKVDQGVFSLWMLAHYFKKSLAYIGFGGKGKQVRDLVHVDDLFELIDIQFKRIEELSGNTYNVGGGRESCLSLLEAAEICRKITGNSIKIMTSKITRYADLPIYISDNALANTDLGWFPKRSPQNILNDIFNWIRDSEKDLKRI